MVEFAYRNDQRFVPPPKRLIEGLDEVDPILEALLRQYYATVDVHFQFSLAQRIAERTIGVTGFFEWESPLEEMPERLPDIDLMPAI
ncbi:MAG: hypothetical protein HC802_11695 [Caldilineaceae bacterium]|nr:hypothetical protein [Caldilineaceae bacterium]